MRILGIAAKWLFILCLPVLLVTASIGWAVNSLWLYKYGFYEYSVNQTPELAEFDLQKIATGLISYFNSAEEPISLTVAKDGELFTPAEISHLRDVKGLIWLDYWVLLGTLIYALAYAGVSLFWRKRRYWRGLAWGMVGGSGLTLALMLALGLGTRLGFVPLFRQFHELFFSGGYEFDPTKDYLIMLFTQDFFRDAALFCALSTAGLAIILAGVAGGYLVSTKSRTPS